jgi:tetratricopeptide (TPR) repeat protein
MILLYPVWCLGQSLGVCYNGPGWSVLKEEYSLMQAQRTAQWVPYRGWIVIALFAAIVLAFGLYPADHEVVAAVQVGDELVADQRYSTALDAYAAAARRCPGCAPPRLRQGAVYMTQSRYDEAWVAYLGAIRVGGLGDEAREGLARLYEAREMEGSAIDAIEHLLARQPERGDLWAWLGELRLAIGEEDGARSAFTRALDLDVEAQQGQRVHDRLGTMCLESDPACAIEHFRSAADGPDQTVAVGAARLVLALYDVEEGNDPALAQTRLGDALFRHGDLELAQRHFEAAVELRPTYTEAHAYLGHVLSTLGEEEQAVHHLEEAIALDPAYVLPRYFLGMHYVRKGWQITGRDILLEAHDVAPNDPAICAAVADTHLREGGPSLAIAERWLHAAVDRAPGDVRFHLLLAHFYVDYMVDPGQRGVAVAKVAVELAPESSEAHETLGWAYHLGGDSLAAVESLERARDLAPGRAQIYYRLGEVYRALGNVRQAMEAYRQAIDLDWNGPIGERARLAVGE